VFLCFVDESEQGDFFGFAALLADEVCTKRLTTRLNEIMEQAAADWGLEPTTEFHAHPMFHGKEDWAVVPTRARVGLFHKVVDAIVDEPVYIILRSVDGRRLRQRQAEKGMLAFIHRRFATVKESDPRAAENMRKLWVKIAGCRLYDQGSWP